MEDIEGDDDVNPLLVNAGEETDQATKTKLWFGKVSKDKISYNIMDGGCPCKFPLYKFYLYHHLILLNIESHLFLHLCFLGNVSRS
jgi:hypothetical protein